MNFLLMPVGNDLPWYRFKITLSGVLYNIRMRFNTRMQRWILDIADSANNDILVGLPVLVVRDLAGRFVVSGLPAGTIFASDDSGKDSQPTRFSFTITHTLFYGDPTLSPPTS